MLHVCGYSVHETHTSRCFSRVSWSQTFRDLFSRQNRWLFLRQTRSTCRCTTIGEGHTHTRSEYSHMRAKTIDSCFASTSCSAPGCVCSDSHQAYWYGGQFFYLKNKTKNQKKSQILQQRLLVCGTDFWCTRKFQRKRKELYK